MMFIRKPAVAGFFYPADPKVLGDQIDSYLQAVSQPLPPPKALIGPHAGTVYSGPVAATAYKSLVSVRERIKRIILLGPAHRVGFEGLAVSQADFFETPLGKIPVDKKSLDKVMKLPQVHPLDEAHREEHSLELHLPFLQKVLGDFTLVPLLVGIAEPQDVAQVLEKLWGGTETLIIISSDLSHYLPYETAKKMDQKTAKKIENLRWQELEERDACGFFPVRGFLLAAQGHHMKGKIVDLRNSGDTVGHKERVVGYGSFLFR